MTDKRTLWFKDPAKGPVQVELAAVDAAHALQVDPDNWSVEKPVEPEPEPAAADSDDFEDDQE